MLTGKRCLISYQWSKFEAIKGRNCDKTDIPQIQKHEKDIQHPARSRSLSLSSSSRKHLSHFCPALPAASHTVSLDFPQEHSEGSRFIGTQEGCLVERFDLLHFPPTTTKNLFPTHLSEQQSQAIWFSFPFNFNGNKLLLWIFFHFLCTETITVLKHGPHMIIPGRLSFFLLAESL